MDVLLPDDVLACILRRLNPRSLAASRCLCKAWRDVVDARSLLRADLLPLSVYGIFFVEEVILSSMRFFARPLMEMEHKIAVRFDYLDEDVPRPDYHHLEVLDHRNGLLLLRDWVVNPATRQCTPLPPPPPLRAGMEAFFDTRYLVFDPAVSPHYHVFSIPRVLRRTVELTKFTDETEWPPSPYTLTVFSSTTRRWEERSFVRQEGEAATRTTIADINFSPRKQRYAVHWRDALYVHSQDDSIIRITLSTHKYQVIPSPIGRQVTYLESLYLGKSIHGVYCALIFNLEERLRIWLLNDDEVRGQTKWVLKNDVSIQPLVGITHQHFGLQNNGLWTLQNTSYEPMAEQKFEWDPDSDITLEAEAKAPIDHFHDDIRTLGFHPYKEILFLWTNCKRVVAYHLNSSKAQDVGKLPVPSIETSFVYTPLLDGEILGK
ncbi:hypothetical protein CFC21_014313 [Triticum aestivum]|uniref:F-box domain-containing protein n=3 Tax=Triticum TaxID=4564 RepID=A0A9R1NFV8_TRITD|nr:uncharacterized protein LOC123184130 [Triticum aestivum]KAF6998170.1 hypothetical protein CFC21_014313 [Triticum aestivum]VAH24187.1 unnamed protein product [Triticum turgidum subsp. durum]